MGIYFRHPSHVTSLVIPFPFTMTLLRRSRLHPTVRSRNSGSLIGSVTIGYLQATRCQSNFDQRPPQSYRSYSSDGSTSRFRTIDPCLNTSGNTTCLSNIPSNSHFAESAEINVLIRVPSSKISRRCSLRSSKRSAYMHGFRMLSKNLRIEIFTYKSAMA